jgi:hypothetical protein
MGILKTGAKVLGGRLGRERTRENLLKRVRDLIGDRGIFVCICVYIAQREPPHGERRRRRKVYSKQRDE